MLDNEFKSQFAFTWIIFVNQCLYQYQNIQDLIQGDRDWKFLVTGSCSPLLQTKRTGGHVQEENAKGGWEIPGRDDKDLLM